MSGEKIQRVEGQKPAKPPMSGARGLGIVMGGMVGIIALLWFLAWLIA